MTSTGTEAPYDLPLYLDHAATSRPRRAEALAAMHAAAELPPPGRGRHQLARAAALVVDDARAAVLEATGLQGIVCFQPGCTYALNQAITGLRAAPGRIALGPMVHNAVRRPALARARALGVEPWTLPHDDDGRIDLDETRRCWPEGTSMVCFSHASNVTGLVQPAAELSALARERGALSVVDAAQTAGLGVLEGRLALGAPDLCAFGAHKAFRSIPGVGALVVGPELALTLQRDPGALLPLTSGGTGHDALDEDMPASLPGRLEAGTPPLPAIAGFGAAARAVVDEIGLAPRSEAGPAKVRRRLVEVLVEGGLREVGQGELPVVSVVGSRTPAELEETLDRGFGIIARAGLHCAPDAHRTLGTLSEAAPDDAADFGFGTLRLSAGLDLDDDDLRRLAQALAAM